MIDYPKYETRHYGLKNDFLKKVREFGTPGVTSALDTLDAALLLLAWEDKAAQSLVMTHQAIEVALKSLLEEVHILLVLQEINLELAKGLAKERIQSHRLGKEIRQFIDVENYDPQKTCPFDEAYRRASQLIDFTTVSEKDVKRLNKTRNAIVHFGGKESEVLRYLDLILNLALPWLDEFYKKAYGVELQHYIFTPYHRELLIAGQYVRLCHDDNSLPHSRILTPYSHRFFEGHVVGEGHALFDGDGYSRDISDWQDENFRSAWVRLERKWSESAVVVGERNELECIICGNPCIIAIGKPRILDGQRAYDAVALHCPSCGLHIAPSHRELARLHYGPITKERVGTEAWDNGVNAYEDE